MPKDKKPKDIKGILKRFDEALSEMAETQVGKLILGNSDKEMVQGELPAAQNPSMLSRGFLKRLAMTAEPGTAAKVSKVNKGIEKGGKLSTRMKQMDASLRRAGVSEDVVDDALQDAMKYSGNEKFEDGRKAREALRKMFPGRTDIGL